jgi:hypothetical protein
MRRLCRALPALAAGVLLFGGAAEIRAQGKPPAKKEQPAKQDQAPSQEKKKLTGKLDITVAVKDGGTLQVCTLYVKDREVSLPAGASSVVVDELLQGRYAVGGDATVKLPSGEVKRRVGVQVTSVAANKTTKATITLVEAQSMEDFCSSCHPSEGQPVEKGQIVRDIHVSGKVLKKKYLGPIAAFNDRVAQDIKDGKPHNLPIVLEKRMVDEDGKLVERDFYTCESCHTVHWDRGNSAYARGPFRRAPDLCQGCHP